jgi:DNA-binding NarL/FixJ family response regulator
MQVIVADDDVLLRAGLASLLERSGFAVAGQASDAEELLDLVGTHAADLVMVDIRMPPTHTEEGLEAARAIREFPHIAILLVSAHIEVEHAMELLASGDRVGYLLKSRVTGVEEFTQTLHRIARGGAVIDPALVHELVSARQLAVLSPREREVLALMAEGRSNTGIARQLWVTEGTVEKHVHSILTKLALPKTDDDHRRVSPWSHFLRRASGYGLSPNIVADQGLDSAGGRWALRDELFHVFLGVAGDQDDRGLSLATARADGAVELLYQIETAVRAEIDVNEHQIRSQLVRPLEHLRGARRQDVLTLKQPSSGLDERGAVITD